MLINSFMQIFEDVCTFSTGTGCEVVMFYGCIFFLYPRHRRVLSNTAICLSVFLSHGAAALGYRHAGCLQLSHRRPSEMCGLRTRPHTDVDPPRVELPSAAGEHIVSPPPVGRYRVWLFHCSCWHSVWSWVQSIVCCELAVRIGAENVDGWSAVSY